MFGRKLQKSFNKVYDATRRQKSELEQQLKVALSKENWMAPNSLLQEIALTSEEEEDRAIILNRVWDIMDHGSALWRRVLKALTLIEVLLKRGSVKIIQDIKTDSWRISKWREHRKMEEGTDVGGGIREKARIIWELLENPEELNRERRKNYELYEKLGAVGAEPEHEERERKTISQHLQQAVGGKQAQQEALQREVAVQNKRAHEHIAVQEFCGETGASEQEACRFLHLSQGNLKRALQEYHRKPSLKATREMCEQVMAITMVPEKRAMQVLEQTRWNVAAAIDAALGSGGNSVQERSTTASSDSESSDSESGESDAGEVSTGRGEVSTGRGGHGARQNRPAPGAAFGVMPKHNGPFGHQQHGAANNSNGWPTPPSSSKSPRANDVNWPMPSGNFDTWPMPPRSQSSGAKGAFGQNDHYASGTGKGGWPKPQGNPFDGKGFGKGGFPGGQAAGFGPQDMGGKGGSAGGFGGNSANIGQQGSFGGYNVGGQKGAYASNTGGQNMGFNNPWTGPHQAGQKAGFGGQEGISHGNGGTNNPFGNW